MSQHRPASLFSWKQHRRRKSLSLLWFHDPPGECRWLQRTFYSYNTRQTHLLSTKTLLLRSQLSVLLIAILLFQSSQATSTQSQSIGSDQFYSLTPISSSKTLFHLSGRAHNRSSPSSKLSWWSPLMPTTAHRSRRHKPHGPGSFWSVLGDPELEYTLKMLESDQLQAALLQFIELVHQYAQPPSLSPTLTRVLRPEQEFNPLSDTTSTASSTFGSNRPGNKFWHSGACVQTSFEPLRSRLQSQSKHWTQFQVQAENAHRLSELLSTLLGARQAVHDSSHRSAGDAEMETDDNVDYHSKSTHKDSSLPASAQSSNLTLHKAFFWSLLQVHLQADSRLAAVGLVFHPSVRLPLQVQMPQPVLYRVASNHDNTDDKQNVHRRSTENHESSLHGSKHIAGFAPYVLRVPKNNQDQDHSKETAFKDPPFRFVDLARLPAPRPQIIHPGIRNMGTRTRNPILDRQASQLRNLKQNLSAQPRQITGSQPDSYAYGSLWYTTHAQQPPPSSARLSSSFSNYAPGNSTSRHAGFWTLPYSDCMLTSGWLLSYSVPFYGRLSNGEIVFQGVVVISVDLDRVDLNQCSAENPLFGGTHKCDSFTTECVPISGFGFRRGGYACQCRPGFYIPNFNSSRRLGSTSGKNEGRLPTHHYFNGSILEEAFVSTYVGPSDSQPLFPHHFVCTPCPPGCSHCDSGHRACLLSYSSPTRVLLLGLQCFAVFVSVLLILIVFRLRRSKIIASSRWIMLEMILLGSFLIYITVIIRYFEPTPFSCFIEPWFRELGFGFCYGAIIIKLYRIYAEFQTRKAHRVCVRDKDLLKYLAAIVLVITGYMAAWSALLLDSVNGFTNLTGSRLAEHQILQEGRTEDDLKFFICRPLSWDHVTQIGESTFLLTGIYLSYCIRNARIEIYREKWALGTCIYVEFLVSLLAYLLKYHVWSTPHPDWLLTLLFLRSQLTVSIVLILLFGPKLCYSSRPHSGPGATDRNRSRYFISSESRDRVPDAMKLHAAILSNGEVDIGDINLADMDPEDIRSELRRVYTQLQIMKNKTIRKDNPHISKRRGGRKGTHRRFSLQPFAHSRQTRSHQNAEHDHETTEISRTPEESESASVEGPSVVYADGPSIPGSSVLSSK